MKISVIIPCYNAERYIADTLDSLLSQSPSSAFTLEIIVMDAASSDGTIDIVNRYKDHLTHLISEPDTGPASAINKGFRLATGEVICWLNADDVSCPGALERVARFFETYPETALAFGRCLITNETGEEIRKGITRFKNLFFLLSSRFTLQCINFISQPASFYRAEDAIKALPIREDMTAAFDYDFHLRLWKKGCGKVIPGPPLSCFRWHPGSISGSSFKKQFLEEWEVAREDAGSTSLQNLIHWFVRWGIVGIYSLMTRKST